MLLNRFFARRLGMGRWNLGSMNGKGWWHPLALHAGAGTAIRMDE